MAVKKMELLKGPQDGARVKIVGDAVPTLIYVGKKPTIEPHVPFSKSQTVRFCVPYSLDLNNEKFIHKTFSDVEDK